MKAVEDQRISVLNDQQARDGEYVLYWMQSSQRVEYNHALSYAADEADKRGKPLLVAFGLTEYPEACLRHYTFMVEGLKEVGSRLDELGAHLVVRRVSPPMLCMELSGDACLAVVDRGYTREPCEWYGRAAAGLRCPLVQVESNVVVPVEEASNGVFAKAGDVSGQAAVAVAKEPASIRLMVSNEAVYEDARGVEETKAHAVKAYAFVADEEGRPLTGLENVKFKLVG